MIYHFAYFCLFISIVMTLLRLIKGPSSADRLMSIDLLTTLFACLMGVHMLKTEDLVYIDAPLILTLLAFFGTLMYSRYLENRIKS